MNLMSILTALARWRSTPFVLLLFHPIIFGL